MKGDQIAAMRDEVIVALLCSDEFDNGGSVWLQNNRGILAKVRGGAEHDGDCTKASHTCLRCLVEEAERRADVFIAVMAQQLSATPSPTPNEGEGDRRGE